MKTQKELMLDIIETNRRIEDKLFHIKNELYVLRVNQYDKDIEALEKQLIKK